MLARAYDMVEIVRDHSMNCLDSTAAEKSSGLAVVQTARGLLHHVRLVANWVEDYLTVASTEWNFHPRGALAAELKRLKAGEEERLRQVVSLFALSLDPCVE